MTGQEERALAGQELLGCVESTESAQSRSGQRAWQRILVTHLGLKMRNWDQHTKSFAASKPGFNQHQRFISAPHPLQCFLLHFWNPPAGPGGKGSSWHTAPARGLEFNCLWVSPPPCVARHGDGKPSPSFWSTQLEMGRYHQTPHAENYPASHFCLKNTFSDIFYLLHSIDSKYSVTPPPHNCP